MREGTCDGLQLVDSKSFDALWRASGSVRRTRQKLIFSDISDSSAAQLKTMRRIGAASAGRAPRQLIAIRIDAGVLNQFRKEARRRRVGYQTRINESLGPSLRLMSRLSQAE